jgi:nanoRNase/pAp phosphatase (c-di-AMP/oligoRNAs hydrolase)
MLRSAERGRRGGRGFFGARGAAPRRAQRGPAERRRDADVEPRFADVGGDFGATASIVTTYLRASGLPIPRALATALFYGIKSDTRDLGREFEPVDVDNYHWLFPQLDHAALSQIEHPSVPAAWFAAFHRAYGRARRHGEAVVADLGKVYAPDIVPELADRLLSLEETRWSLVIGDYEGHLHLSIRTSDRRMNAGKLVLEIVSGKGGSAGGHGSMAGGRIALPEGPAKVRLAFRQKLVAAFLRAFGAPKKGEKIVRA